MYFVEEHVLRRVSKATYDPAIFKLYDNRLRLTVHTAHTRPGSIINRSFVIDRQCTTDFFALMHEREYLAAEGPKAYVFLRP